MVGSAMVGGCDDKTVSQSSTSPTSSPSREWAPWAHGVGAPGMFNVGQAAPLCGTEAPMMNAVILIDRRRTRPCH